MPSPTIDISWSLVEAEAAHAGFSEIGLAHFWVGVCKTVELWISELLKASIHDRTPWLRTDLAAVIDKALQRDRSSRPNNGGKFFKKN